MSARLHSKLSVYLISGNNMSEIIKFDSQLNVMKENVSIFDKVSQSLSVFSFQVNYSSLIQLVVNLYSDIRGVPK